jgi:release factor glutamine methyltransferase
VKNPTGLLQSGPRMTKNDSIGLWINQAAFSLTNISETPQLEAQVLAAHALHQSRTWLLAHLDFCPDEIQKSKLETFLSKRLNGQALPYILGSWEFFSLDFFVSEAVLIPRPETELLVSEALDWLNGHPLCLKVADVGTGSGCIAVSLLLNNSKINLTGFDISRQALQIAKRNIIHHGCEKRINLIQSDLLAGCSGQFDLICSNLPYIPSSTLAKLDVSKTEPLMALDGGDDGFKLIDKLLQQIAINKFSPQLILLEFESTLPALAEYTAHKYFPKARINIINDLSGLPRILKIEV